MATLKHIASKNSDYTAIEAYLVYQHDAFTGKQLLDEQGKPKLRDSYLLDTLECGDFSFATACLLANRKYGKNTQRDDIKSHQYIISFDPRDAADNGLTMEKAQALGLKFCEENFSGHPAIVCTHPDGHNHSGNIHVHIVIGSIRTREVERKPYMQKPRDWREGMKHSSTAQTMRHLRVEVMELCEGAGLYQIDLLCILVFRMGAFGAAFATVFSQAVAGIGSLIYIGRHYPELKWSREEGRLSASHCLKLCNMGIPMGLQCSITAIGSVVLQGAVNGLGSSIVAAQTAGSKAAQFLSVPLESIGTAMTTYASQNMGAHDLKRVDRGVNTALGIGCVYSVASFLILRVLDVPLISLFLESSEVEIMANARSFIFWNSVFYIPLAVLIIYRYTIQGLGYSGLAMFAGVAEMVARAMVGFWFVPLWGYFAACIASPVAWFFACFFLIPAYFAVRKRLTKELAAARVED